MMKLLIIIGLIFGTTLTAQEMNKFSIGANIGVHGGLAPTALYTKLYQIHHYGINGRYMFNNRVGVMLDLGYDLFDFIGSGEKNTSYFRTSVQGVVNAGDILKVNTISNRLGLLIHGGAGISHMWVKKEFRKPIPTDFYLFKSVDDMANFIIGATPQFKINEKISLNADLSFIFHHKQNYEFDMNSKNNDGIGYFINASVGATFYLGSKAKHADWIPTEYVESNENASYEARIKELEEKAKDDDGDGVPNYIDTEPNTVKDAYVNFKGEVLLDSDNDGIADIYDLCPNIKGLYSLNGCIDSDNDGVSDNEDDCPTVAGTKSNRGCPEIYKETKEVMTRTLKDVQFETNKDILLASSFTSLNEVVKVMMEHPEYLLRLEGHTDNVGTDEDNLILSQKRANAVSNYLVLKGISKDRFDSHGYGESQPKALNDTEEGKALNRRVELTIAL